MAQSEFQLETDAEVADFVNTRFDSREVRSLASNAGISRSRGDTKRQTVEKLVAQDPALAANLVEADPKADVDADLFRSRREVGQEHISLDEARTRARHRKMFWKLRNLSESIAALPSYEAQVTWEYGSKIDGGYEPGLTSITVKRRDDAEDVHWILDERVHIILTPHGRCIRFEVGDNTYVTRNTAKPNTKWSIALSRVERLYEPSEK